MSKAKKSRNKQSKKSSVSKKKENSISLSWWMYGLIATMLAVALLVCFALTSRAEILIPDEEVNFEEQLFSIAEDYAENPDYPLDSRFSLNGVRLDDSKVHSSEDLYMVKINNIMDEQGFEKGDFIGNGSRYDGVYEVTEFSEFNNRQLRMIESARKHVIEYIKDSNVLRDKDDLIEAIQNVPVLMFTSTLHEELLEVSDAPAVHAGSAIFCNEKYEKFFSEYMFAHEMIHHLRYLTHNKDFGQMMYVGTKYDEGITDFITRSTGLESPVYNGYITGYSSIHSIIGEYLNLFGEKGLEGFFYGTEEFIESFYQNFEAEHHAFVCALGYYDQSEIPCIVCECIIKYWNEVTVSNVQ